MLLFFPNIYRVGMANMGFQTIYRLANAIGGVSCDRCFLPEPHLIPLIERGEELVSMEVKASPREFPVLAFSISFELDLLNVIRLLHWSRVEPLASLRREEDPLVIMGGIVPSANPEPFAPLADVIVVGEGEEVLPRVLKVLKEEGIGRTRRLLSRLAWIPGVYVPSFYNPKYDHFGRFLRFEVRGDAPFPVKWAYWQGFSQKGNQSSLVTPYGAFPQAFLLEVSRGCPYLCKFCLSAYLYRPLRMVDKKRLLSSLDVPFSKVGFIGTSLSHYPYLVEVVDKALSLGKDVSFSSLRLDAPLAVLKTVCGQSKRGTFGIEAAGEELRKAVGKPLSQELLMDRLLFCVEQGAQILKLYFMIGLPGEKYDDVEALSVFPKGVFHQCRMRGLPLPQIHLSLAPFVSKPHTPFQWSPMETRDVLRAKIRKVESDLRRVKGVVVTGEGPKWSLLQGLISKGDRRVGEALVASLDMGGDWNGALKTHNVSFYYHIHRTRDRHEPFPWEVVDTGWEKEALYSRAFISKV